MMREIFNGIKTKEVCQMMAGVYVCSIERNVPKTKTVDEADIWDEKSGHLTIVKWHFHSLQNLQCTFRRLCDKTFECNCISVFFLFFLLICLCCLLPCVVYFYVRDGVLVQKKKKLAAQNISSMYIIFALLLHSSRITTSNSHHHFTSWQFHRLWCELVHLFVLKSEVAVFCVIWTVQLSMESPFSSHEWTRCTQLQHFCRFKWNKREHRKKIFFKRGEKSCENCTNPLECERNWYVQVEKTNARELNTTWAHGIYKREREKSKRKKNDKDITTARYFNDYNESVNQTKCQSACVACTCTCL